MKSLSRFLAATLIVLPQGFLVGQQDTIRMWTGAVNNNFRETQNWNPAGPPEDTHVIIPPVNQYPVLSSHLFNALRSVSILAGGRLDVSGPQGFLNSAGNLWIDSGAVLMVNSTDTVAANIGGNAMIGGVLSVSPLATGRLDFQSVNVVGRGSLVVGGASQMNIDMGGSLVVDTGGFVGVLSNHINPVNIGGDAVIGGTLDIAPLVGGYMNFGRKLIVPATGLVHIAGAVQISNIQDDLLLNGSLDIDSGVVAAVWCRGDWERGPGSSFSAGQSTFYFTNEGRQLKIDRGTFNTLILGPVLSTLRIDGNVNVGVNGTLTLRDSVVVLPGDTLTILNTSITAIIDTLGGRIVRGAVRRALTASTSRIRFQDSNINLRFLNTGGIPNFVTIDVAPDSNLVPDPLRFVRRFYDIGREGGSGFEAELTLRYDPSELDSGTVEDSLRLWRSTDDGRTWQYVPSRVDVVNNVVIADTVREFSKWGFGLPTSPPTQVADGPTSLPSLTWLAQNYPNPFNPMTTIQYTISKPSLVTLKVINVIGQDVGTLIQAYHQPGNYSVQWIPTNLPSGVYFYRLQAGNYMQTRKMLYVR